MVAAAAATCEQARLECWHVLGHNLKLPGRRLGVQLLHRYAERLDGGDHLVQDCMQAAGRL